MADPLTVDCPRCNAPTGAPCFGARNNPRSGCHTERHTAAQQATPATPTREHRNYDHTPPECPRCDSTGQMIVSQDLRPGNAIAPHPEEWWSIDGWGSRIIPAHRTIDRRYAPCTECSSR